MVKQNKKLWARYERIKTIIGTYIALFLTIPILIFCFCGLAHQTELESDLWEGIVLVLKIGLKWYALIMPIITILYLLEFFWFSSRVEFTDNAILYYRWLFSKKSRAINYDDITECVLSGRLWNDKREKTSRRKIILFNKTNVIIEFDINNKLALMLEVFLGEKKFKLVSDKGNLKSISNYYDIDFISLNYEEQLKILSYYCKINYPKYKTGKEILKIK